MIIKSNIKEAFRSLYSSKQRTILALIGIIIGIGAVISMVSIGKIVQNESLKGFKALGTDILTIQNNYSPQKNPSSNKSDIRLKDILYIPSQCDAIEKVSPFIVSGDSVSFKGKKIESGSIIGVTESYFEISKVKISKGRAISDLDKYYNFCVLGNNIYEKVSKIQIDNIIGEKIKIGRNIFIIIGFAEKKPLGVFSFFDINESVFIEINRFMRMGNKGEISNITAKIKPGVDQITAKSQIIDYFKKLTKANNSVNILNPEEIIAQMEKQMQLYTLFLGAIGSISLLVGGVGVMNVMLVSVTERSKEIGLRRALGARRKDIRGQFLVEAITLSIIGGIFGIILGVGISFIIAYFVKWDFLISYNAIALGVIVSSAVGIFFGLYPAHQASKLDPIVTLRTG
ncbi:MAG: ABC transporter permease [Desulfobacterales bacterium]|nr:ABC transporter permease [Desulfobacterales bacterium]